MFEGRAQYLRHRRQGSDEAGAGGPSEEGDDARIAAEVFDVSLDPHQRRHQVGQAEVVRPVQIDVRPLRRNHRVLRHPRPRYFIKTTAFLFGFTWFLMELLSLGKNLLSNIF